MTTVDRARDVVHLCVLGNADDDTAALRQQLAVCLSTSVREIQVHVEDQDDLGVAALQALSGVAGYLRRRGGGLTVVGASPRLRRTLAAQRLDDLLPPTAPPPPPSVAGRAPALPIQEQVP